MARKRPFLCLLKKEANKHWMNLLRGTVEIVFGVYQVKLRMWCTFSLELYNAIKVNDLPRGGIPGRHLLVV